MSAPDQVTDLYRELARHRVEEAIDRLGRAPLDRLVAQAAEVLEEAAGALACMTALYATPGGLVDERWQQQINDLIAAAASLEQLADFSRHCHHRHQPRPAKETDHAQPQPPHPFAYRDAAGARHRVLVRQSAAGAWQVLDITVVETLAATARAATQPRRSPATTPNNTTTRPPAPAAAAAAEQRAAA